MVYACLYVCRCIYPCGCTQRSESTSDVCLVCCPPYLLSRSPSLTEAYHFRYNGWLVSPRSPPVSVPSAGLAPPHLNFMWTLGTELRSSYLHSRHFTNLHNPVLYTVFWAYLEVLNLVSRNILLNKLSFHYWLSSSTIRKNASWYLLSDFISYTKTKYNFAKYFHIKSL